MNTKRQDLAEKGLFGVIGLLGLHLLTSLRFEWEGMSILSGWLALSPDFLIVLGGLWLGWWLPRLRLLLCGLLALLVLLVPLYRFGATVMPFFYDKEFLVFEDIHLIPGFFHLMTHHLAAWMQVAALIGVGLAILLVYAIIFKLWLWTWNLRDRKIFGRRLRIGFALVVFFGLASWAIAPGVAAFSPSMITLMARDLEHWPRYIEDWEEFEKSLDLAIQRSHELPPKLDRLEGTDVYLVFIESYGRAPFSKPETRNRLVNTMQPMEDELARLGYDVVTGYLAPSVSGGGSGLAHMELLTGQSIANKPMFEEVLETDLRPLPRFFASSGYRCLNVQPAMTIDWDKSQSFYGFTQNYFQHHLPYGGHDYFWGMMPDQHALATIYRQEVKGAEAPLFVMFVSVTSHAPFNTIPPYYEDWSRCARPDAFAEGPALEYDFDWSTYLSDPRIEQSYTETLTYSLQTCIGFLGLVERDTMMIILGDHQPPGVSDLSDYDASYAVPIHIISNIQDHLIPFVSIGHFRPGLIPSLEAEVFPSHQFFPAFVNIFGTR